MLKSLRNENLFTKYMLSFLLHLFFLPSTESSTCTMNFNFTLHFSESYFQFNRKYLFEVILHFLPRSFRFFFSSTSPPRNRTESLACTRRNHFSCILLEFRLTVYICMKRHADVMSVRNKLIYGFWS